MKKRLTATFITSFVFCILFSINVSAKTYTANGWATKYSDQAMCWCDNCGYEDYCLNGDVDDYECPYCETELGYRYTQRSYIDNLKYRHVDYTVKVKKNKACWVKFPTSKRTRRAKLGRYGGSNWYDWAEKVSGIKHVTQISGRGIIYKSSGSKIKLKCSKTTKFIIAYKNYGIVVLRVQVK